MFKWISIVLLLTGSACSKIDHFTQEKAAYQRECFGDGSVKCRSMLIELNVTKLEAAIEMVEVEKGNIIACRGQQFYDDGLIVIREKIAYFNDLKPGRFARVVFSNSQVEFNSPPFEREPDFRAFLNVADNCRKSTAGAAPHVTGISGQIDSNSDIRPAILETVAGHLAREQTAIGQSTVTLNGNSLFNGADAEWQFPLRIFQLSSGRQAILMGSSGGRGTSCETLFFFLVADSTGMKPTPEFGTCSTQGSFSQIGDRITLTLPKMGGKTVVVFDGVTVTEDGELVPLQNSNDPAK